LIVLKTDHMFISDWTRLLHRRRSQQVEMLLDRHVIVEGYKLVM